MISYSSLPCYRYFCDTYTRVFSESVDNGFVYTHSAQPLVRIACQGGYATAMVYGQTGSGKVSDCVFLYVVVVWELMYYVVCVAIMWLALWLF